MIDETTSISEGLKIVKITEETQKHYHTKTCKKHGSECRFGMPRYPIWKTILTKPVKGDSAEEKTEKKKKNKETIEAVREVLDDEEAVNQIVE